MSYRMGTYALGGQPRHLDCSPVSIAFDQGMNTKPGDRLATAVEKDVLGWRTPLDPRGELARRVGP